MILVIAACWMTVGANALAGETCPACHRVTVAGRHAALPCLACHLNGEQPVADPAESAVAERTCGACHRGSAEIFTRPMTTRTGERQYAERAWGRFDREFFGKNCNGCHVESCRDCHGASGHRLVRPGTRECLACHRGYVTGPEYAGLAPREENARYRRGPERGGEQYLKMLPDVHFEKGMACGACHTMASLVRGEKSAKGCRDCHTPSRRPVEHRIAAHMTRLACTACHAAWAAQEYGTFYLRFVNSRGLDDFDLSYKKGEYARSVYLKRQDAPPLGIDNKGLVAPIRPQFIAYYSEVRHDTPVVDNALLTATWRTFTPHTIRRGTVMCEGCHDAPRRFLMEKEADRIYNLPADGMGLASFWNRSGQQVANGGFLEQSRFRKLAGTSIAYRKAYIEKWKEFSSRVVDSSPR
jgi:hypothetical protein